MSSAALAADRTCIADINAQLGDLQESIRLLEAQKKIIQDRLDAYKYPVLSLPTEITSEIFLHSLPLYPLRPPMTGRLSPTTLTHVCRRWRSVALATPALWRAMTVACVATENVETQKDVLKSWLTRSGCFPLSIRLDPYNGHLQKLISSVTAHRAR
ncbi:hypothetical protein C8R43DRAFT_1008943 [Mycena crocata]|nr:hypothetical protein C8R43DRAFT_1008943 [Mycena crocata]